MKTSAKIVLSSVSIVATLAMAGCGRESVPVVGVTLKEALELEVGEKYTLQARVWPTNADNKTVSWESSNPAVAKVDAASGEVEALSLGSATVTATAVDGGKSATCKVTVAEPTVNIFDLIPDRLFRLSCESADTDKNGHLSPAEAAALTTMDVSQLEGGTKIVSLEGIQYFTGLETLIFTGNEVVSVDLSHNTALEMLYCGGNRLTALDLSANTRLSELICSDNKLSSLDVTALAALTFLHCGGNDLTEFDISKNTKLFWFNCDGNPGVEIPDERDPEGKRTRRTFVVRSWFDGGNIPSGKVPSDPTQPNAPSYNYSFSTTWTYGDKEVTADYRKVVE